MVRIYDSSCSTTFLSGGGARNHMTAERSKSGVPSLFATKFSWDRSKLSLGACSMIQSLTLNLTKENEVQ